jgi:hypothetical protein
LGLAFFASGSGLAQTPAGAPGPDLAVARETLAKYYEAQKLISKEKADWALAKEMLATRVEFLKGEIALVRGAIQTGEEKSTKESEERAALEKKSEALTRLGTMQETRIAELEAKLQTLLPRLPAALGAKVKPLQDKIPTPGAETKATLAERYAYVLAILKEINKSNGETSVLTERRKLRDGREAEVEALYLGLARAYYSGVGDNAGEAGVGVPAAEGFAWTAEPDEAKTIRQAIQIFKNEAVADYVALPVGVK